jgi:hypothetical protein
MFFTNFDICSTKFRYCKKFKNQNLVCCLLLWSLLLIFEILNISPLLYNTQLYGLGFENRGLGVQDSGLNQDPHLQDPKWNLLFCA